MPPIKYFGGKGMFYKTIIEEFPDKSTYNTYIEPFGGSYTIGLHSQEDTPVEIYNDMWQNVYSLYKVMSEESLFNEFKKKCDLSIFSEDFRYEYKELLKRDDLSLLDRAFYYFYVNRTSRNGIGGISINTIIRRKMSKSTSDFLSAIDRLPELHQRLSKVIVLNRDGIELIRDYNRENVFFYLDPPYTWDTRGKTRYAVDMSYEQQENLLDACLESKAKIVMSGYDNPLYDKLLDGGFTKKSFEVDTVSGTGEPKTKIETLWKNF